MKTNNRPPRPGAPRTPYASTHYPRRRAATRRRRQRILIGVAAVALCALAFGAAAGQLSPGSPGAATPYVSPYQWEEGLVRDGDRLSYSEQGVVASQVGVDVSDHQGAIDWQAVANDGISFAFVRVGNRGYTEGGLSVDERFAENIEGAAAAGLDVGTYFFSQAITVQEAQEEADLVIAQLDGRPLALPVVFDHEPVSDAAGRANNLDSATRTACARAFCERLESAGYTTMIYGNAGDMASYNRADLGNGPLWFAEYDATIPHAQFDFAVWQYTNSGTVAGINTPVDLNLRMTDAL